MKSSLLNTLILLWLSVFLASCGKPDGKRTGNVLPETQRVQQSQLSTIDSLLEQVPFDGENLDFNELLEHIPDRNSLIYRDAVSSWAWFEYMEHNDTVASLDSLKRMAAQTADESERLGRYLTIGIIYQDIGRYDSAKVYWKPVFEYGEDSILVELAASALYEMAISKDDTLEAAQYERYRLENAPEVSQLNEKFQRYLEQEEALERQKPQRKNLFIGLGIAFALLVLCLWYALSRKRNKKDDAAHEEERLRLQEEKQHFQEESQRLQAEKERMSREVNENLVRRANKIFSSKADDACQRILAEFNATYPKTQEQMMAAFPDLAKQEYELCVLGYFDFRAKEIAQLMGLQENTVYRYRSVIRKKTGTDDLETLVSRFLD